MGQILLTDDNPCDGCEDKVEDTWGLFCNITCGKHSVWAIRQDAYKAQLKKVVDEGERLGVLNLTEEKGIALARTCLRMYNFWQALLKEVE